MIKQRYNILYTAFVIAFLLAGAGYCRGQFKNCVTRVLQMQDESMLEGLRVTPIIK